jgi:cytochrome P450
MQMLNCTRVAGSDTTATAIRVFLWHVLSNAVVYSKVQDEIDQGIKSGLISDPIKQSEAKKMPYLQACIQETLRIRPPAVGMAAKVVPPEGDTIEGYYVPGGTWIGYVLCLDK